MAKRISEAERKARSYLRHPYARVVIPEEDGTFRAEIAEFPGCIAIGDTIVDAISALEEAALDWLVAALDNNQPIPRPIESSNDFSGKLVLRLPRSLHKKATWVAEREGTSLNQLIATSLAETVGERKAAPSFMMSIVGSVQGFRVLTATPAKASTSTGAQLASAPTTQMLTLPTLNSEQIHA